MTDPTKTEETERIIATTVGPMIPVDYQRDAVVELRVIKSLLERILENLEAIERRQ